MYLFLTAPPFFSTRSSFAGVALATSKAQRPVLRFRGRASHAVLDVPGQLSHDGKDSADKHKNPPSNGSAEEAIALKDLSENISSIPFVPVDDEDTNPEGVVNQSEDTPVGQDLSQEAGDETGTSHSPLEDASEDHSASLHEEESSPDEDSVEANMQSPSATASALQDDEWFSVKPIAKPDMEAGVAPSGVLDLSELDQQGRHVLAKSSYNSVVDIDIEEGGFLTEDDDNNELFSGVGIDALIDNEGILENLRTDLGIETATHVQLSAIPRIQDKTDLVMQSHTGTGKTLAFLLPLLDEIDADVAATQVIVSTPTRELGMQISRECDRLIVNTGIRNMPLIGGANPVRQSTRLRRSTPHIVVGTPGRISELIETRDLKVRPSLQTVVIDEVDECMAGELSTQIMRLLRLLPRKVQKVLVSATGDVDSVRQFAGEALHKPVLLRVGGAFRLPKQIDHWLCVVPPRLKLETVRKLMHTEPYPERAIVFVNDARRVEFVAEKLYHLKMDVGAMRGAAGKEERKEVLNAFRKGDVQVLVTTEVAARGLDVREISHVINLDLPTDADHYVHRAGRCGRVRRAGTVINISVGEHAFVVSKLARELNIEIPRMEPRGGSYQAPLQRSRVSAPNGDRQGPGGKGLSRSSSTVEPRMEPGGGSYQAPLQRRRESAPNGDRKGLAEKGLSRPSSTVEPKGEKRQESSEGWMEKELEELQTALSTGDDEFLERKYFAGESSKLKEVTGDDRGSRSTPQKAKKPKLTGKKKLKLKEKKLQKTPKKERKFPNRTAEERRGDLTQGRLRRDVKQRATMERWVGNRETPVHNAEDVES